MIVDLYTAILDKGLKGIARIPTLFQRICVVEMNTHWHFRYFNLAKKRTKVISFYRLLRTGMTSLIP